MFITSFKTVSSSISFGSITIETIVVEKAINKEHINDMAKILGIKGVNFKSNQSILKKEKRIKWVQNIPENTKVKIFAMNSISILSASSAYVAKEIKAA